MTCSHLLSADHHQGISLIGERPEAEHVVSANKYGFIYPPMQKIYHPITQILMHIFMLPSAHVCARHSRVPTAVIYRWRGALNPGHMWSGTCTSTSRWDATICNLAVGKCTFTRFINFIECVWQGQVCAVIDLGAREIESVSKGSEVVSCGLQLRIRFEFFLHRIRE